MMEELYEKIVSKLTDDERLIIRAYIDSRVQTIMNEQVKVQLEIQLKYERELENIQLKQEKELEKVPVKQEKELEKVPLKHKKELPKGEIDPEVLKVKYRILKYHLIKANWDRLTTASLSDLRSFLDFFDRNRFDENTLDEITFEKKERFEKFAKENKWSLKQWDLSVESFSSAFQNLCEKVTAAAHPVFKLHDIFVIEEENLEPPELKIIGFLWEKFPLPKGHLYIKDTNNRLHDMYKIYRK